MAIVEIVQRAGPRSLDPAIAAFGTRADGDAEAFHLRQVHTGLLHHGVVVADFQAGLAGPLPRRCTRDQIDRAGQGVAAIQRTLRPAQHLDIGQVHKIEDRALSLADVDAIHVHADGRVPVDRGIDLRDAAYRNLRDCGIGGGLADLQTGRQRIEVIEAIDATVLDIRFGEGAHGHRHVLQFFLAPLRGDDDFLQRARAALGLCGCDIRVCHCALRECRDGHRQTGNTDDVEQTLQLDTQHDSPRVLRLAGRNDNFRLPCSGPRSLAPRAVESARA